jgi:UDP-N-acetylmuramate--alanine ligase
MELEINKKSKVHFIGIGGIGMSGIALIMKNLGYDVQGSDTLKKSKILDKLKSNKIRVYHGHKTKSVLNSDIVVISTAIKSSNQEFKLAKSKKIQIIKRADMLAHLLNLKSNIIISGSHGKTTITSLVSNMLSDAKYDPMIINGGILNSIDSNAMVGNGDWSVVEADESDGSFLKFKSIYSVVSNIDLEHMDYYGTFANLKKNFQTFLNKTPLLGKNIVCIDDKHISSLLQKIKKNNLITYGFSKHANIRCSNLKNIDMGMQFDLNIKLLQKKYVIKNIRLNLLGKHNVLNATAAVTIGLLLKIGIKKIKSSLQKFSGVQRRLTIVHKDVKKIIYDDYAHHPTEIKAVLEACRNNYKNKNLVSIFQPHRYTRVKSLYKEFTKCFNLADLVVVCPVYAAGENSKSFNFKKFCKDISTNSKVQTVVANDQNDIELFIKKNLIKNQVIIAMGAGSISSWIRNISFNLKKNA